MGKQLTLFEQHYVNRAFDQFSFVRLCLNDECSVPHFSKNKRFGKGAALCEFCDSVTINVNKTTFLKNIDKWDGVAFNFYDKNDCPTNLK